MKPRHVRQIRLIHSVSFSSVIFRSLFLTLRATMLEAECAAWDEKLIDGLERE